MFIDTLGWRIANIAGALTVWICVAATETYAAATHVPLPSDGATLTVVDAGAMGASSVAWRLGGQPSAILRPLTGPSYDVPTPRDAIDYVPVLEPLGGAASTYDPTSPLDRDAGGMMTASGEIYDPDGWTAAIQIDLRDSFGGVRYGRNYRVTHALIEAAGKQAIVRINDVGPLKPGRIVDLNRRTMAYFDPTMTIGVLADIKVTPLEGNAIAAGPVEDAPVMAGDFLPLWAH